jgi:Mrp family chromosome partitioning ATPase
MAKQKLYKGLSPLDVARCSNLAAVVPTLMQLTTESNVETVLITSCNAGEGKTTTAIKLALAAAIKIDQRVLLIDCNPVRPILAELFDCAQGPGFYELLCGKAEAGEVVQTTAISRLHLVPFGSNERSGFNAYTAQNIRSKLRELSDSIFGGYDLVVVDGDSGADQPDLSVSAGAFDGVVMVLECEGTRWEVAQHYESRLSAASASMIGTVMNKRKFYIPKSLYA